MVKIPPDPRFSAVEQDRELSSVPEKTLRLVHEVRMPAMATEFAVMLPHCAGHHLDGALEALGLITRIEQLLSVYLPESDVSRVNQAAGTTLRVPVSPDAVRVLQDAAAYSQQTDGAFDVTAGPLIDAWGFTKRSGRKPTDVEVDAALELVGWQKVSVEPSTSSVRLERPGMKINLGAIGKGYALDRVAEALVARGIDDFLIHGGNSTVMARGAMDPLDAADDGWLVGLQHPGNPHQRLGGIRLRNAAMSTSGPGKQFFHHRGKRYGHVIDPRSGWPAGDMESLTVLAASAAESDALATGWFVCGRSDAIRNASATEPQMPIYCVTATGRQNVVEVELAGGAVLEKDRQS